MKTSITFHAPEPLPPVAVSPYKSIIAASLTIGDAVDVTVFRDNREDVRTWLRNAADAIGAALVEMAVQDALAARDTPPAKEAAEQAEAEAIGYDTADEAKAATADEEIPL